MAQPTIRWGILGCGDVAEYKSGPALYRTPGSELVAVMRRDAAKAQDFARRHGAKCWYTDAESLVADPEVNAVYIALPHDGHPEHVALAARVRRIVLCEKPMGVNVAQAQACVDVCKTNDVPLTVAYRPLIAKNHIKIEPFSGEFQGAALNAMPREGVASCAGESGRDVGASVAVDRRLRYPCKGLVSVRYQNQRKPSQG